jgi:D-alanyl-D-alanine carboxypeptidase
MTWPGVAIALAILLCATPTCAQSGEPAGKGDAVVPVSPALCNQMRQRHVLNPGSPLGCERLRLLKFGYVAFDGQLQDGGEMVVMDAVADQVLQIFVALRARRFPIAKVRLMDHYNGDDDASTADNNTSAFNVRQVAGGGGLSLHAFGAAIDLNPFQNPYVTYFGGRLRIDPPSATAFVSRKELRPGMAEAVVDVFAEHGFVEWGGRWRTADYQHFQVGRALAYRLARLPAAQARDVFERFAEKARACVQASAGRSGTGRRSCLGDP